MLQPPIQSRFHVLQCLQLGVGHAAGFFDRLADVGRLPEDTVSEVCPRVEDLFGSVFAGQVNCIPEDIVQDGPKEIARLYRWE